MSCACVLAVRVDPNRTSGGLCTRKYIELLAACMPLRLITMEEEEENGGSTWLQGILGHSAGVEVFRLAEKASRITRWIDRAPVFVRNKVQAAVRYGSGQGTAEWDRIAVWRRVAQEQAKHGYRRGPIFAFGAGMDFTPHIAMASSPIKAPWIAYYHDPWPGHLYPEPYQWKWSIPGWHQERWHRRILRRAPALAFPSARLRDWVLAGELEPLRDKAFILPHLATGPDLAILARGCQLPEGFRREDFNVTHAGTMLRHRSPWALLEGFLRFVSREPERQKRARLWQVGWVDRHIQPDPRWKALTSRPEIRVVLARIPYDVSMEILHHSVAGVVLEAVAEESPFYPGKLADLLYLRKPILAVTPAKSTVRDMLGGDYPLLCVPDRPEEVAAKLEILWEAWKRGAHQRFGPPEAAVAMASPEAALREIDRMLAHLQAPAGVNSKT